MAYKRKETLKEIVLLQNSIGQYFESESFSIPSVARTWAPPVDLYETEDHIFLYADLPGVGGEDLEIEVQNNFITIRGQRKFEKKEGEDFLRVERNYGPFQRTFRLPHTVMDGNVFAEFKMGVLKINMRKDTRPNQNYIRVKIITED